MRTALTSGGVRVALGTSILFFVLAALLSARITFGDAPDSVQVKQTQLRRRAALAGLAGSSSPSSLRNKGGDGTAADEDVDNDDDDDRWSKYVTRTLAEELRAAREAERQRAELAAAKEREGLASAAKRKNKNSGKLMGKIASKTGVRQGAAAVRRAGRRVRHYFDDDEEEGDDDDGYTYVDDDDDEDGSDLRSTSRRRRRSRSSSISAQLWSVCSQMFWLGVAIGQYISLHGVWTPMTYLGAAMRWSADFSWRTTQWTGERALVGPIRTATAPLVYLTEGLLFIFVWLPARFLRAIVRELYPVYVYLGAALAVGTAMGIAAAVVLYIGSYVFGDQSTWESSLHRRGEQLPLEVERRFNEASTSAKKKSSKRKNAQTDWTTTATRVGGSIVEQAIRESLLREKRAQRASRRSSEGMEEAEDENEQYDFESAWQNAPSSENGHRAAPDSDEEDDYFGSAPVHKSTSSRAKGKGSSRSSVSSSIRSPAPSKSLLNPLPASSTPPLTSPTVASGMYGRTLPVGATGQGGWTSRNSDSNSSTPIASPVYARPQGGNAGHVNSYGSGRSTPSTTPAAKGTSTASSSRISPDAIRAHQLRHRSAIPTPTLS